MFLVRTLKFLTEVYHHVFNNLYW
uniref:Uncharacterized protein n=1 Tax=Rhizophora mucronata TaxID=61149 RepID=A0A2P2QTE9_RHIMU